jgi:hypothetical protein
VTQAVLVKELVNGVQVSVFFVTLLAAAGQTFLLTAHMVIFALFVTE